MRIFAFLFAALLCGEATAAAPPLASEVTLERLSADKAEMMLELRAACAQFTPQELKLLPAGWVQEYLRLWAQFGLDRVVLEQKKYLLENFTRRERVAILKAARSSSKLPKSLEERFRQYADFSRRLVTRLGSVLGELAERNLKEKKRDF